MFSRICRSSNEISTNRGQLFPFTYNYCKEETMGYQYRFSWILIIKTQAALLLGFWNRFSNNILVFFNLMRVSVTKYQMNFDAKVAYVIFRKKALTCTAATYQMRVNKKLDGKDWYSLYVALSKIDHWLQIWINNKTQSETWLISSNRSKKKFTFLNLDHNQFPRRKILIQKQLHFLSMKKTN